MIVYLKGMFHMHNNPNEAVVRFLNRQAISTPNSLPLSFFKSGQFLALTPDCQGGIILQKQFYTDFVGSGAVVGSSLDVNCLSIYVIGAVEFHASTIYEQRQQAFQKRMDYSQQLQEITQEYAPHQRAFLILQQLSKWVGLEEVQKIPNELVAQMAGLFPETIEFVRKNYSMETSPRDSKPIIGSGVTRLKM